MRALPVLGFSWVAWLLLASLPAAAEAPAPWHLVGDPVAGEAIAGRWCASCHAVGPGATHATDAAPTLRSVAERPTTTVGALRVFLRVPHDRMPDLSLTREETDDLIAYIISLRRR